MDSPFSDSDLEAMACRSIQIMRKQHHLYSFRGSPQPFSRELPREILAYTPEEILEDINELALCVRHQLWTAASLMAFRLFEDSIRTHVSVDLRLSFKKLTLSRAIGHCEQSFSKNFVQQLHRIRRMRNEGMHAVSSFDSQECLSIVKEVLWLTYYVFSIPPE